MKLLMLFLITETVIGTYCENVVDTEMFIIPITPIMFNWTNQISDEQYTFRASLLNKPDLPQWLHYIYSVRHHSGFIYGTPPLNQSDIVIQIIGLNKTCYETKEITIPIHITKKTNIAKYELQIKIDNLNVDDLFDGYRMERLKDIFRKRLWRESSNDLYTTFMVSAIDFGARLPLKPNEEEGVVLKLGSFKPHSTELLELQEEVRPLFKKTWCPKDFKRTKVERFFRDAGFNLDWCTFRLFELATPNVLNEKKIHSNKTVNLKKETKLNLNSKNIMNEPNRWFPPAKEDVPRRSYVNELLITIIIPLFVMILLVSLLSMILCFHHEGITARNQVSDSKVDFSNYHNDGSGINDNNQINPSNHYVTDNHSNRSTFRISPNNSLSKHPSPKSNHNLIIDYNRPQPPPYLGTNTNSLVLRQKQALDEEIANKVNQARTLEESLQMLNEANIINPNYHLEENVYPERNDLTGDVYFENDIDVHDGENNYISVKPNLSIPFRRHTGLTNGAVTNGNIFKNLQNF